MLPFLFKKWGSADGSFVDRMVEILRKTPGLRLEGNRMVTLKSVRPPASQEWPRFDERTYLCSGECI
jgi:hypothetical protein